MTASTGILTSPAPFDGQLLPWDAEVRGDNGVETVSTDTQLVGIFSDGDSDTVADIFDNCLAHDNPDQQDRDGDGYGDVCDADLNDDGVAGATDLGLFAGEFGTTGCVGLSCLGDLDGDSAVDGKDLAAYAAIGPFTLGPSALRR